jgi:hypothetical protein
MNLIPFVKQESLRLFKYSMFGTFFGGGTGIYSSEKFKSFNQEQKLHFVEFMNKMLRSMEQSDLFTPQEHKLNVYIFDRGLNLLFNQSTLDCALVGGWIGFWTGLGFGVLRTSISIIYNGLLHTCRLVFVRQAGKFK